MHQKFFSAIIFFITLTSYSPNLLAEMAAQFVPVVSPEAVVPTLECIDKSVVDEYCVFHTRFADVSTLITEAKRALNTTGHLDEATQGRIDPVPNSKGDIGFIIKNQPDKDRLVRFSRLRHNTHSLSSNFGILMPLICFG